MGGGAGDLGAAAGGGTGFEAAAEHFGAVGHGEQAQAGGKSGGGLGWQSASIVDHSEPQLTGQQIEMNVDAGALALSDGQIRFFGLASMTVGIVLLLIAR